VRPQALLASAAVRWTPPAIVRPTSASRPRLPPSISTRRPSPCRSARQNMGFRSSMPFRRAGLASLGVPSRSLCPLIADGSAVHDEHRLGCAGAVRNSQRCQDLNTNFWFSQRGPFTTDHDRSGAPPLTDLVARRELLNRQAYAIGPSASPRTRVSYEREDRAGSVIQEQKKRAPRDAAAGAGS
jgi:hypothetical protein